MEATSIAAAQGRLDGTRFAVLLFTNLTQDHLDFHGTMESYFAAKRALFEQAERSVVNVEDEWGRRLAQELGNAVTFTPDDDLGGIELHLRGRFNRANALGAIAAARALDVPEAAIRARHRARSRRSGPVRVGGRGAAVRGHRRLRAHAGLARERAARRAQPGRRPARGRVRRGRRPGSRETAADGQDRRRARRPGDRHDRQSAHRGAGRDRRSGRGGCGGLARGDRRPRRRDRCRDRRRRAGRRGRDRRQGRRHRDAARGYSIPFDDKEVAREALRRTLAAS